MANTPPTTPTAMPTMPPVPSPDFFSVTLVSSPLGSAVCLGRPLEPEDCPVVDDDEDDDDDVGGGVEVVEEDDDDELDDYKNMLFRGGTAVQESSHTEDELLEEVVDVSEAEVDVDVVEVDVDVDVEVVLELEVVEDDVEAVLCTTVLVTLLVTITMLV
ncbi:hypothetical protein ACHAQJ_004264 [Trichoderma viride]